MVSFSKFPWASDSAFWCFREVLPSFFTKATAAFNLTSSGVVESGILCERDIRGSIERGGIGNCSNWGVINDVGGKVEKDSCGKLRRYAKCCVIVSRWTWVLKTEH